MWHDILCLTKMSIYVKKKINSEYEERASGRCTFLQKQKHCLHAGVAHTNINRDVCFAMENVHPAVRVSVRKCDNLELMIVIMRIFPLQKCIVCVL